MLIGDPVGEFAQAGAGARYGGHRLPGQQVHGTLHGEVVVVLLGGGDPSGVHMRAHRDGLEAQEFDGQGPRGLDPRRRLTHADVSTSKGCT